MSVLPSFVCYHLSSSGSRGEFILDPSPVHHMINGLEMCFYSWTKIIYETVLKRLECELRLSLDKHLHTCILYNGIRYSVSHICTLLETDLSSWLLLRFLPSFFFFFSISQSRVWGQKMKHVVHCTDCEAHWGDVLVILDSITTPVVFFFICLAVINNWMTDSDLHFFSHYKKVTKHLFII